MPTEAGTPPRARPWVVWIVRLAVLATTTVLALVCGEYILRAAFRNARTSGNARDFVGRTSSWSPGPSNQLGFRERDIPPKSAGTYRIVVVGDSFTWGQGI